MTILWVLRSVVRAIHEEQMAEHGGAEGGTDEGLLESALVRPVNLNAYAHPSIADLAAAYGFGLVRNHPFVDGNKRVSLVVTHLFLALNGFEIDAPDPECVLVWQSLAAGTISEAALAVWIQDHLVAMPAES